MSDFLVKKTKEEKMKEVDAVSLLVNFELKNFKVNLIEDEKAWLIIKSS